MQELLGVYKYQGCTEMVLKGSGLERAQFRVEEPPKLGRLRFLFLFLLFFVFTRRGPAKISFLPFQSRKHKLKLLVFINERVLSLRWELSWYLYANGSGLCKLLVFGEILMTSI